MNREALKKRIYSDHRQLDAEALEQIQQDSALRAELEAVRAQDVQLRAAHEADVPDDLLENILAIPREHLTEDHKADQNQAESSWGRWLPGLLGGAFALALGIFGVVMWQAQDIANVKDYVADHHAFDVPEVLAMSQDGISADQKNAVFQQVGLSASPALNDRIRFVKICPTPGGSGAHMVVETPDGLATIIYMPKTQLSGSDEFTVADLQVVVMPLDSGSVAVMANSLETAQSLMQSARAGFRTRVRT